MSSYYATARSNYFRVTSIGRFLKFCKEYELKPFDKSKNRLIGFTCNISSGSFPTIRTIEFKNKEDELVDCDINSMMLGLSKLLVKNEVAIIMEVGNEQLQYVIGFSYAINSEGKTHSIDINDIYNKTKKLSNNITEVLY